MDLQLFQYSGGQSIRLAKIDEKGVPWFVAKDVCDAVGIKVTASALRLLPAKNKADHTVITPGGPQQMTIVNEAGLYKLVLKSRKPEAEAFGDWVTETVLPSIRKTGGYEKTTAIVLTPQNELDAIESNARGVLQLAGQIRESRRIADEALAKAETNTQEMKILSGELAAIMQRREEVIASIPVLPPGQGPVEPRTVRSNLVELLRWAAVTTETRHSTVTSRLYRDFNYRYGIDFLARRRHARRRPGQSRVTGIDMVEQANELERVYALAVELFGRPSHPLPASSADDED
jgi:prophage antirepressor-like protein